MKTPNETALKDKVRTIAKAQQRPFNIVWRSLVLERFLVRVANSSYRKDFIFKGGMLLAKYVNLGRETADLDFLLKGLVNEKDRILDIIQDICSTEVQDGFQFTILHIEIVEHVLTKYPGYELRLDANCGNTQTKVSVDIGVGGWAEPMSKLIELTGTEKGAIFEQDISLMVYPLEMILAEKLQTACFRGASNSRMKDYHDLYLICQSESLLDQEKASYFIGQVFIDRDTPLSLIPDFSTEELKNLQLRWVSHRLALTQNIQKILPETIAEVIKSVNSWFSKNVVIK